MSSWLSRIRSQTGWSAASANSVRGSGGKRARSAASTAAARALSRC